MTGAFSESVSQRRIGNSVVTIITEGTCPWAPRFQVDEAEWRRAVPEADLSGKIVIDFNLAHVSINDASILIDPGFEDPSPMWKQRFEAKWPGLSPITRSPGMQAGLASLGIRPEEITHVLITHAHDDHYSGVTFDRGGGRVARFPRARHLLGRDDWNGNPERTSPDSDLTTYLGVIDQLGLLDLIDREHEVVPGVTMIPTPGETPGHSIVRVLSAGKSFYFLGDLFHHSCEVEHTDWVPFGRDQPAVIRASRHRLIDEAVPRHSTIVFAHERFPAWGHIIPTQDGHKWERAW